MSRLKLNQSNMLDNDCDALLVVKYERIIIFFVKANMMDTSTLSKCDVEKLRSILLKYDMPFESSKI